MLMLNSSEPYYTFFTRFNYLKCSSVYFIKLFTIWSPTPKIKGNAFVILSN